MRSISTRPPQFRTPITTPVTPSSRKCRMSSIITSSSDELYKKSPHRGRTITWRLVHINLKSKARALQTIIGMLGVALWTALSNPTLGVVPPTRNFTVTCIKWESAYSKYLRCLSFHIARAYLLLHEQHCGRRRSQGRDQLIWFRARAHARADSTESTQTSIVILCASGVDIRVM